MKQMMSLRDKSGAEMRAILTAEQQAVFDKNMAEAKAQMEARQHQAPPRR
jgi:Spy/CpxP family protein refolding chaperone